MSLKLESAMKFSSGSLECLGSQMFPFYDPLFKNVIDKYGIDNFLFC